MTPRDGSIGKQTYAQVEALVKQGKSKTEAFAQIASETGRNSGTVSANYYRVARAAGAPKRRGRDKQASTARSTPRRRSAPSAARRSGADIDRLTADLVTSVTALTEAVKRQETDVASLRDRLDSIRRSIG
jgi:small-conductance mechanosensitive channel